MLLIGLVVEAGRVVVQLGAKILSKASTGGVDLPRSAVRARILTAFGQATLAPDVGASDAGNPADRPPARVQTSHSPRIHMENSSRVVVASWSGSPYTAVST